MSKVHTHQLLDAYRTNFVNFSCNLVLHLFFKMVVFKLFSLFQWDEAVNLYKVTDMARDGNQVFIAVIFNQGDMLQGILIYSSSM